MKPGVERPSERLSPYEVISKNGTGGDWKDVVTAMQRARSLPGRNPVTPPETGREAAKQTEREIER